MHKCVNDHINLAILCVVYFIVHSSVSVCVHACVCVYVHMCISPVYNDTLIILSEPPQPQNISAHSNGSFNGASQGEPQQTLQVTNVNTEEVLLTSIPYRQNWK